MADIDIQDDFEPAPMQDDIDAQPMMDDFQSQPMMDDMSGQPDRRDETKENLYKRSIFDVGVTVNVSVGRAKLRIAEILELRPDAIIALTASLDDPIDLTVDDRVIARGELIETDDGALAVRVTEIEEPSNG